MSDKNEPSLVVGEILDDRNVKCEVVECHATNIKVKILEIKWDRLGTYLDEGKTYPAYKHSTKMFGDRMEVWEIAPKHMKRSSSQVLLCWEKGRGWSWDLDF